jgi:hypothetical protein
VIAIVTLLFAFPLGFLLSNRLAANTAYAVVYLWAFVFQGIYLMLEMLDGGENPAFEPDTFPMSYGIVALTIFGVGFGLVQLGHRVGRGRRERRQESSRSSLTGTSANAAMGNAATSANVAG